MIQFPPQNVAHVISNPQGWIASINHKHIQQFFFTGHTEKITDYNTICSARESDSSTRQGITKQRNKKYVIWIFNNKSNTKIHYYTPNGTITDNIDEAWTFNLNTEFFITTIGIDEDPKKINLMEMIVQDMCATKEGLVVYKRNPFNYKIINMPGINKAFMSHDGQTIFVATNQKILILDNPLLQ